MTQEAPATRAPPADAILAAAIGVVAIFIVVLVLWLSAAENLHQRTLSTIGAARGVRDQMLYISQSMADVEATRRAMLMGGGASARDAHRAARAEVTAHVAELNRISAGDVSLSAAAAEIATLVDRDLALDDRNPRRFPGSDPAEAATHENLRDAMARLRDVLNASNDAARQIENQSRRRLNAMATVLALLALLGSVLAILALRRERMRWRVAHDMAEQARAAAAASDLAKTRFLAAASHDMRQPLHALTLYLSALGRRTESDEARSILAKAERAAHSLAGMFATLLDLARIQAQVIKPELQDFPLHDLLDRVGAEFPDADVRVDTTMLTIHSDFGLLERLLRNLVSNALKHGGGGARIEVRADSGAAEISVIDSGPGIAKEDQERIFEEFTRLDGRSSAEGLGLGLPIVRHIANLLHHDLQLRSAPGEGAAFTLRVPLAQGALQVAPRAPSADVALNGLRVLVMDDDASALEAMTGALRDLGAEIHACARESDVLVALEAGFAPQLLVMDLRIDGALVGIDIAHRARAKTNPAPGVVMVTADTAADTLSALRASGFAWLIKPVDPRELASAAFEAA